MKRFSITKVCTVKYKDTIYAETFEEAILEFNHMIQEENSSEVKEYILEGILDLDKCDHKEGNAYSQHDQAFYCIICGEVFPNESNPEGEYIKQ